MIDFWSKDVNMANTGHKTQRDFFHWMETEIVNWDVTSRFQPGIFMVSSYIQTNDSLERELLSILDNILRTAIVI